MAQSYEIEIKEILSKIEKVEVNSLGEAIDKAMRLYDEQKIILYPEDCQGVDFLPLEHKENSR